MNYDWGVSLRYVDTDVERARWRSTINYRVTTKLQLGVEINPGAEEVGPLASWFLLTESHGVPAVFLGTSSDRIGTSAGEQSYYATVTKHAPGLPVSAYVTLNYSEHDDGFNVPFGGTVDLPGGFSVRPMWDGAETHLLVNLGVDRFAFSAMWVWLERAGLSMAVGF